MFISSLGNFQKTRIQALQAPQAPQVLGWGCTVPGVPDQCTVPVGSNHPAVARTAEAHPVIRIQPGDQVGVDDQKAVVHMVIAVVLHTAEAAHRAAACHAAVPRTALAAGHRIADVGVHHIAREEERHESRRMGVPVHQALV
jgi:hypothetical protein